MIEERIKDYKPASKAEELNLLKEIVQEITLMGLSRAQFFKQGAFQGGTCLRIVYGLPRFSEDLDFILFEPQPNFMWHRFLSEIRLEFEAFGLSVEVKDRSEVEGAVKKAFLKDSSFGQVIKLRYKREKSDPQVVQIKLEIDTNPPGGSNFETQLLDFPVSYSIVSQTLPSLFAGKLHALLCRSYPKGRDWFDYTWYVSRRTAINYEFLQQALYQQGPWAGQQLHVNHEWLIERLSEKVESIDWNRAKRDVEGFLKPLELESLELWTPSFFKQKIQKM
jgi:predicted nucleotidyltransferase component of viral defense system